MREWVAKRLDLGARDIDGARRQNQREPGFSPVRRYRSSRITVSDTRVRKTFAALNGTPRSNSYGNSVGLADNAAILLPVTKLGVT
jgi:hypothetical protein